ncbi:conserved hypothetical protein [Vibrio crassostreae]|uniref:hypothetical protein n=1 Tax=Vibrio splendidus TaxID=29497 RepID=UPI000C864326|nr:hypothetical protein [Vibrio splendidus]CAK2701380.1 conserved hypothetical protein [Vibrio crassostreae]MCC4789449.1 hypothetical protein [Vibrio splendidus]PMO00896.1 hypothetical protein BCT19_22600 [Vibrio splendidus]CAK3107960.1 conserved hypothetical protein [Vibrio crassostreae]CAK3175777.1 conserved hypothetical protein [Vibrio crassostreae]
MSDSKIEHQWPEDYPTGLPENQDVVPAYGQVCRLVNECPPTCDDFKRHRDEEHDYTYNTTKKRMLSYGVSFWTSIEAVKNIKAKYPADNQFGLKKIVIGTLIPELGVVTRNISTDGHVTLWKQVGAEPHPHFTVEVNEQ